MRNLPENNNYKDRRTYPNMTVEEIAQIVERDCFAVESETYGSGNHTVIFLPQAIAELKQVVYWGERHAVNIFEQQFQGLGHIFDSGNSNTIVVSHVLYIYSASRGPTHAKISEGICDTMLSRLENERRIYNDYELAYNKNKQGVTINPFVAENHLSTVVLSGHTHPDLGVFFSQPDRNSGCATPDFPAVTFVCDPIRRDMKAMVGVNEEAARIIIYESNVSGDVWRDTDSYVEKSLPMGISEVLNAANEVLASGDYSGVCKTSYRFGNLVANIKIKRKKKSKHARK